MAFDFDDDRAATALGDGRYAVTISDRWSLAGGNANGGYVMALCLSALAAEATHPDPLTITISYLRQSHPGPAEVLVETIRSGRRLTFAEARLVQDGRELARMVATFADLGNPGGKTIIDNEAPALPDPDQCLDLAGGASIPGLTLAERTEFRVAQLPGWRTGTPSGKAYAEFWMRFSDGREPDSLSLGPMSDMAIPVSFELGIWATTTVELSVHVRARPAPGWLACRVSTRHVQGGYEDEDVEIWDSTGRLVAQSRQLMLILD